MWVAGAAGGAVARSARALPWGLAAGPIFYRWQPWCCVGRSAPRQAPCTRRPASRTLRFRGQLAPGVRIDRESAVWPYLTIVCEKSKTALCGVVKLRCGGASQRACKKLAQKSSKVEISPFLLPTIADPLIDIEFSPYPDVVNGGGGLRHRGPGYFGQA